MASQAPGSRKNRGANTDTTVDLDRVDFLGFDLSGVWPWRGVAIVLAVGLLAAVIYKLANSTLAARLPRPRGAPPPRALPPLRWLLRHAVSAARADTRWVALWLTVTGLLAATVACVAWTPWWGVFAVLPLPALIAVPVALLVAVVRVAVVLSRRFTLLRQVNNQVGVELRTVAPMWETITCATWRGLTHPRAITIVYSAAARVSEQKNREKFEQAMLDSCANGWSWVFTWEPHRNQVIAEATPPLPRHAPLPAETTHVWNEIPLGIGAGGETITWSLDSFPHALVTGATGQGKSVLQRGMLLGHVLQHPVWRLVAIDLKRVEMSVFKKHPAARVATTLPEALSMLENLEAEMHRRYTVLESSGRQKWMEDTPNPVAHLLLVDELFQLLALEKGRDDEAKERDAIRARCTSIIGSIARLGRGAGIHMILATQRPDATVLPGETKANMEFRVAVGRMDMTPSLMVLDSDRATITPKIPGRAVARKGADLLDFQGFWIPGKGAEFEAALQRAVDLYTHRGELVVAGQWDPVHSPAGGAQDTSRRPRQGARGRVARWLHDRSERAAAADAELTTPPQAPPPQTPPTTSALSGAAAVVDTGTPIRSAPPLVDIPDLPQVPARTSTHARQQLPDTPTAAADLDALLDARHADGLQPKLPPWISGTYTSPE